MEVRGGLSWISLLSAINFDKNSEFFYLDKEPDSLINDVANLNRQLTALLCSVVWKRTGKDKESGDFARATAYFTE